MKTPDELLNEYIKVGIESISYQRAGIDDNLTEEMRERDSYLFNRKIEIISILKSMGYEIVDGDKPYSRELKKIK
jgi:hypothetical protein